MGTKPKEIAGYVDDAPFYREFSFRRPGEKVSRVFRGTWYAVAPALSAGVVKEWIDRVLNQAAAKNKEAGRTVIRAGVAVEVNAAFVTTYGVMAGRVTGTYLVTKRMRAELLRTGRFQFVRMQSPFWAKAFLNPAALGRVQNELMEMTKMDIKANLVRRMKP